MTTEAFGITWLSPDEAFEVLDRAAQRTLHISGHQFIENWKAGKYEGQDDEDPAVDSLIDFIPFARPQSASR